MKIFISKSKKRREDFIKKILEKNNGIYIYPKNLDRKNFNLDGIYKTTYESINDKDVWLHINSLVGDGVKIMLENPTRYPKITSPKFQNLQRLSMRCGEENAYITDIVPFTISKEYIYTTFCYIGRQILGYPHWYAFRENYEEYWNGKIKHCHDSDLLAYKTKDYVEIDYEFFSTKRIIKKFNTTDDEKKKYAKLKKRLFESDLSYRRIITKLADLAHADQSRLEFLLELMLNLKKNTIVYTNLSNYANNINKLIKKNKIRNTKAISYQLGNVDLSGIQNVIYMESPITNSYYFLDTMTLTEGKNVFHILGDSNVDKYLFNLINNELNQIDSYTKELWKYEK
jgi:hypothetical protein